MAFASSAQAGITIPAGDWTVDIGGNVNAFYTNTRFSGDMKSSAQATTQTHNVIQTGLLPSAIGIGGKTRQNDLDIAFQFTFFVGSDSGTGTSGGGNPINVRQSYMTFGDASWGSIKMGRDLGVFGSDAILSDMTLSGVGSGAGWGGSSTLGRIGTGYQYADWVGQISYTSPNWNGFQVTGALREPWASAQAADASRHNLGFEGKATYDFAANDVTGRIWVGGIVQGHEGTTYVEDSTAFEVGAKAAYQGAQLVGYYYNGENMSGQAALGSHPNLILNGFNWYNATVQTKDSGGYVQGTFTIPGVGTKLGASWGTSQAELKSNSSVTFENRSWIVGAYHPLTKSLNLVAEYTDNKVEASGGTAIPGSVAGSAKTVSLGAIMFF